MEVVDLPDPDEPGAGEVVVRPSVVGICGSDFHLFHGELGPLFPRIQGHELSAVVEQVGRDCGDIQAGQRVAIWPVVPCGDCYPCAIGRESVCTNLRLVGIHFDGGLQERLRLPATQVFPIGDQDPAVGAFIEPTSIGVRTVARARIDQGERVVVLGAGPIGQAVSLVARERGASVLLVDRIGSRLEHGRAIGAEVVEATGDADVGAAVCDWAGQAGPAVVVDATGDPAAIVAAVEMVAGAGRVIVAGISDHEVTLPVGAFTQKELDVLGVSCCTASEFAEAVRVVARNRDAVERLITHRYPLERAPEALTYAMEHPAEVMKAVVQVGS
jgi:L-gulonate 5-dehydrogenase